MRTDLASCDRLRPAHLADAGNSSASLARSIEHGITGEEAGTIAVRGIKQNDALTVTDKSFGPLVQARFDRIINALTA